jgi:Family of unknown function (DUF6165)
MIIKCEISLGELVDKISILRIKLKKIVDPVKLAHIRKEEQSLSATLNSLNLDNIEQHLNGLIDINSTLWKIEDDIREFERAANFNHEFIELARLVYKTNDERFNRKNKINTLYKSGLEEVKSYKEY